MTSVLDSVSQKSPDLTRENGAPSFNKIKESGFSSVEGFTSHEDSVNVCVRTQDRTKDWTPDSDSRVLLTISPCFLYKQLYVL